MTDTSRWRALSTRAKALIVTVLAAMMLLSSIVAYLIAIRLSVPSGVAVIPFRMLAFLGLNVCVFAVEYVAFVLATLPIRLRRQKTRK